MESSSTFAKSFTSMGLTEFLAGANADASCWSVLESGAASMLVVDLDDGWVAQKLPQSMPVCPVVGFLPSGQLGEANVAAPVFVDLVVDTEEQLRAVSSVVAANPHAATVLVQLLRSIDGLSVQQGLFAESLAYSTLQHGAEFERWLDGQSVRPVPELQSGSRSNAQTFSPEVNPAVLVSRHSNTLLIELNRPERRNAFSTEIRDLLCEALELARFDGSIERICLRGVGQSFCAGGDLAEFGAARDASRAHLSRTTRHAGALIHLLRDSVRVKVQGACIGAGIELPAFAGEIHAAADSFFQLPEVSLGLVPGAGGCVSLPRRIGRHRTAYMALSGARVEVDQALEWGLIDKIVRA